MSTYDDIAEWYDSWVGADSMGEDPFFPAVEALMGEVAARRICDLAERRPVWAEVPAVLVARCRKDAPSQSS